MNSSVKWPGLASLAGKWRSNCGKAPQPIEGENPHLYRQRCKHLSGFDNDYKMELLFRIRDTADDPQVTAAACMRANSGYLEYGHYLPRFIVEQTKRGGLVATQLGGRAKHVALSDELREELETFLDLFGFGR